MGTNRSSEVSSPKLSLGARRYLPILLLAGLAVHVILPQVATLERSLQVIKRMAPGAVLGALVAQILSYLGSGYLLQSLAAMFGQRLSLIRGTLITMATSSIGLVVGGLAYAAAAYSWVRGSGVSAEAAFLAGWLPNLFNSAALAIIGIFGLLHLLMTHELSGLQAAGFGLTLLVLAGTISVMLWGVGHRSRLTTVLVQAARRWAELRRRPHNPASTEAAVGRLFGAWDVLRRGGWRGPAVGAALNTLFDVLTLCLLFVAAGYAVSPGVLLTGYGLPLLLGKVTFLPGGVGIVEGTMVVLFDGLGVPDGVTVVVTLVYRFMSFWLPTLVGFPLVPYLQRVSSGAVDGSR